METIEGQILTVFLTSIAYFTVWFTLALFKRRFDIIDIAWGGGFVAALFMLIATTEDSLNFAHQVLLALVIIWALRLMIHVYLRNRNRNHDARYEAIIQKFHQPVLLNIYFRIFIFQAIVLTLISLPLAAAFTSFDQFNNDNLLALGFAIFAIGFIIELFADQQLSEFIKNNKNKNKILDTGLWKYSRHPNYFGEVTVWWGLWLVSMSINPVWWSVIGPVTITAFIMFISGIPLLEKRFKQNKAYQEYAKKTSIFFPLPPKLHGK